MERVLFASALIAGLAVATAATAADLGEYPVPPPPQFSWAGFYVGANGGFGGDRFDYLLDYYGYPVASADLTSSGFVYGGQVGYNFMLTPSVLLGIEADIQGTSISGNLGFDVPATFSADLGTRVDWFGTVRGRLGWAYDRFLLYATGGWAYGQTTAYANSTIGSTSQSFKGNGWTAGGGAEYAFTDHWTLKTEYLYVNLGSATLLSGGGYNLMQNTHFHVVRAGLNYKF